MAALSNSAGRILALDVGGRRIGMAVTDALGLTAQGIPTLQRRNKRADLDYLRRVIRRHAVAEIVVGLPLRLSGSDSAQTNKVRRFAADLEHTFSLPVHLWDERLTTAEAQRILRQTSMGIERRGAVVDQMAAVLILQSFLDARAQGVQSPQET